MKQLLVMRHAKSSWESDAPNDHARPLNDRGRRDAPRMGEALRERGSVPDLVLSSDSQRTRETWEGLSRELGNVPVEFTRDLYHAGPTEVAELCSELELEETVMVLGHNPGWENVVEFLTGEEVRMTTANCAVLEAEGEWSSLMQAESWRLVEVLRPKEL